MNYMTQSEANKQLQEAMSMYTKKYDRDKGEWVADHEKLKEQGELIKSALENGADIKDIDYISDEVLYYHKGILLSHPTNPLPAQKLLQLSVRIYADNPEQIARQAELIKIAMENGGDPNKLDFAITKVLINNSDLLLNHPTNPISPQKLLHLAMQIHTSTSEQIARQTELIKIALANGADVNYPCDGYSPLYSASNREVADFLISNGARCEVRDIRSRFDDEVFENGLGELQWNPKFALVQKYKNLEAPFSEEAKMPYNMFHIWLTSKDNPREMRPQDIENAIKTKDTFLQSNKPWEHVVWTNDLDLIPESIKKLNEHGIKVKSIYDYKDDIELLYLVEQKIEEKKWGMASDTLRYGLINKFGGVYADINFIFNRDVVEETHKYNFFTMTYGELYIDNFFFGASACHPIMKNILSQVERNLVSPPSYIANIEDQDSTSITDMSTANPSYIAYYKEANKNGNIDVVYPIVPMDSEVYNERLGRSERVKYVVYEFDDSFRNPCDEQNYYARDYLHDNEICGGEAFNIGHDSPDGRTWVD